MPSSAWTLSDELEYISKLGSHNLGGAHRIKVIPDLSEDPKRRRLELLKGYRESMQYPRNWGSIDPDTVASYVDEQIQGLENEIAEDQKGIEK